MKKHNQKQFLLYYIAFILIFISIIISGLVVYVKITSQWSFFIIFLLLVLLTFVSYAFKKQLFILIHQEYIFQIKQHVIDPIHIDKLDYETLYTRLKNKGYSLYYHDQDIALFIKVTKDTIRKVFAHHILQVAVFNLKPQESFYHTKVDDMINAIQFNSQTEEKKRIDRLLITQFQRFETFNDNTRQQINEILFVKTDKHIVSTINVGLLHKDKMALLLASKQYSPSSYYTMHVNEIESLLS